MKNRAGRDPYAPKRNLSAYLLFQNAMRDSFKAENPSMSFGELSKYTSLMYSQLTVEEKAAWQARAEQDKERYLHEMSTYVPSAGYDQNGNAIAQYPHVTGSKKKQRDPMAPKRNLSAYLLYQNAMRDQFKSDNPGEFGSIYSFKGLRAIFLVSDIMDRIVGCVSFRAALYHIAAQSLTPKK